MKHLTTKWLTTIFGEVNVSKSDGSVETTPINKDDIVNLGYIENETLKEFTGRIDGFITNFKKTPFVGNTVSPVDTIKTDIELSGIVLDCSKQYASNVVTLDAREIVEASDTTGVVKVTITPNIKATITVVSKGDSEPTETTIEDIKVGSEIDTITVKKDNGTTETFSGSVVKFLYKEDAEKIIITHIVIKDTEDKVHKVAFKDIMSLSEEPPAEEEQSGEITPPDGPSGEDDF